MVRDDLVVAVEVLNSEEIGCLMKDQDVIIQH